MARDFFDDINMQGQRITGLGSPLLVSDAVNKEYVDSLTGTSLSVRIASGNALLTDDVILATGNITLYDGTLQTKLLTIKNILTTPIKVLGQVENKTNLLVLPNHSYTLLYSTYWRII